MVDIAHLGLKVDSSGVVSATNELDKLNRKAKKTEKSSKALTKGFQSLKKSIDSGNQSIVKAIKDLDKLKKKTDKTSNTFNKLKSVIATLGVTLLTKQLIDNINTYTALSNKLKLVTTDSKNLLDVQNALFDVSQDTRASLEGVTELYTRISRSTKDLKLSQGELLGVTQTINKAIAVSGATAQSAEAALFQFGQGLAADALRGQELNSILEQTPRLARLMADGLGVGIGQLRTMGAEGKLNAKTVINAIQSQTDVINKEFGQTEKTISQAMQQIKNSVLKTFGSVKGGGIVDSLDQFREIISDPKITEGLKGIAKLLITMTSAALKVASALGTMAGKLMSLGENFGKFIADIGQDETVVGRIQGINSEMERLGQIMANTAKKMQAAPGNPLLPQTYEKAKNKLIELQAELSKLTGDGKFFTAPTPAAGKKEPGLVPTAGAGKVDITDPGAKALQKLRDRYATEQELLDEKLFNDQVALDQFRETNAVSEQEHQTLLQRINEKYAEDDKALTKKTEDAKNAMRARGVSIAGSIMDNLAVLMTTNSKKLFEIGKIAAIASSTINTYQAITKTMTSVPYPWNIPLAAAQGIAGFAQVANIKSQSFGGGGGGAGSVGGGGASTGFSGGGEIPGSIPPPTETSAALPESKELIITVEGDGPHSEGMRKLIENISETVRDMGGISSLVVS